MNNNRKLLLTCKFATKKIIIQDVKFVKEIIAQFSYDLYIVSFTIIGTTLIVIIFRRDCVA